MLVAAAGMLFVGLGGDAGRVTDSNVAEDLPRYTIHGAQWRNFDQNGAPLIQGRASRADYFDDESIRFQNFEVAMISLQGTPWAAQSPEASVAAGGMAKMTLHGGVSGQGYWPDGASLEFETDNLTIDSRNSALSTDAPIVLTGTGREVSAVGARVDSRKQKFSLQKEVEMRYAPN